MLPRCVQGGSLWPPSHPPVLPHHLILSRWSSLSMCTFWATNFRLFPSFNFLWIILTIFHRYWAWNFRDTTRAYSCQLLLKLFCRLHQQLQSREQCHSETRWKQVAGIPSITNKGTGTQKATEEQRAREKKHSSLISMSTPCICCRNCALSRVGQSQLLKQVVVNIFLTDARRALHFLLGR